MSLARTLLLKRNGLDTAIKTSDIGTTSIHSESFFSMATFRTILVNFQRLCRWKHTTCRSCIYISCVFIRFPSKRSKRNPFLILFHRNRAQIQLSYGLFRWLFSPSVTKNIFSLVLCFQAEKFALLLITLGWHDLLCPEVREQGGLAL